ncbi:MAG TPA: META domain-containing protein [Candidatus Paceibacterota bacterium]
MRQILLALTTVSVIGLVVVFVHYDNQNRISKSASVTEVEQPAVTDEIKPSPQTPTEEPLTVFGYYECLPLKPGIGEATLECALGIALDQSDGHLALDTQHISQPLNVPTGTKVMVSGYITPVGELSSVQKYDIDGVLRATSIAVVSEKPAPSLKGKDWRWVRTELNDGTTNAPEADEFGITLAADGTFTADTDCNSVGGRYSVQGSTISFTDIFSTKMYCEGSLETLFIQYLTDSTNYHFGPSGELILNLKLDSGSVIFK